MKQIKLTTMRKRAEIRSANLAYTTALHRSKNRATMETERHYLNTLLFQGISPQLRTQVLRRKTDIARMFG